MTGHQKGTASVASRWCAGGGAGEGGEAVDEGGGPDVEVVGPAVVEEVPDDLRAGRRGGGEHRRPAREVEGAGPGLDQVPAQAVAHGAEAEAGELAVVGRGVGVVAGAGDQVEAAAGGQAVGGAFPAAVEEAPEERRRRGGRLLGEDGVEERLPLRDHGRGGVAAQDVGAEAGAEAAAEDRLADEAEDGGRGGGGILVRGEEAAGAVDDLLEGAVVGRGDGGEAGEAGLGDDVGHALAAGEPDEDVERGEEAGDVGAVAEEAEGAVEAERGGEGAELDRVLGHEGVGPADDEEAGGGLGGVDEGGGVEEVLDALLAVEAADPADRAGRRRAMPRAARTGAAAGGVELGRVDHRGDLDRVVRAVGHAARRRRRGCWRRRRRSGR